MPKITANVSASLKKKVECVATERELTESQVLKEALRRDLQKGIEDIDTDDE